MPYSPTILNVAVTALQAIETSSTHPNLYGMLIHSSPANTVDVLVSFDDDGATVFTLSPDGSIRLGPEMAPNTGAVYIAAADGETSSAVEVVL